MANIPLKDGLGFSRNVGVYTDANGDIATGNVPLVGGAPVTQTNPLPINIRPSSGGINQTVVVVPAGTSTTLIAAKASRVYLAICNIGLGEANLSFGAAAVANSGWPLSAATALGRQGGGMTWNGGAVPLTDVRVFSATGTTIVVLEG